MRGKFLKHLRLVSLSIFLIGVITSGVAYAVNLARRPQPPTGLTMTMTQSFTRSGSGQAELHGIHQRFQKSDGSYVLAQTYYNAQGEIDDVNKYVAQAGRGVFRIDRRNKFLSFLSPLSAEPPAVTEEKMKSFPNFVREDSVMGYKTLVFRSEDEEGGYTETHLAPALQMMPVKLVSVSPAGVGVTEPAAIELGEPPPTVFADAPDYAVDYAHFEEKIEAAEKAGHSHVAEKMRAEPARMRQAERNE